MRHKSFVFWCRCLFKTSIIIGSKGTFKVNKYEYERNMHRQKFCVPSASVFIMEGEMKLKYAKHEKSENERKVKYEKNMHAPKGLCT